MEPSMPIIPSGTPEHKGPSVREGTIAMTEAFGPKVGHHIPGTQALPSEHAAAARPPLATHADLLPSVRESTIAMTEKLGPKEGHYISPSELPASQRLLPQVDRPMRYPKGPGQPVTKPGIVDTLIEGVMAAANPPEAEAQTNAGGDGTASTAIPELLVRDTEGRLPSVRESTIAMTEAHGPKSGPQNQAVPRRPSATSADGSRGRPVVVPGATSAVSPKEAAAVTSVLAKPLREWGGEEVKAAAAQVLGSRVVMGTLAVGAAALTVFSIYKGVEMYNHYRLTQSIVEVEQEQPSVAHLYIHRRSPLAPSVAIPCTRVETLLRVGRVPYVAHVISDPTVSPNGELPFIVFSGKRVAGVQNITEALKKDLGVDLDAGLSKEELATGVALMSAVRYSLVRGYLRSVHVDRPDVMRPYYSEMNRTPDWLTRFALSRMRRHLTEENERSGYSQLSGEQYVHELLKDVRAIEAMLESHTYLFSNEAPSTFDCALYAWLLPVVAMEDAAEVNEAFAYIVESEGLTNYVRRMTELAFPDLDELVYGQAIDDAEPASLTANTNTNSAASNAEAAELNEIRGTTSDEEHTNMVGGDRVKSQSHGRLSRVRGSGSARRRSAESIVSNENVSEETQSRPSNFEVRLPGEL